MRLLKLTLESFRSYRDLTLPLENSDNGVFVLLGENATGKTNILESISVLALLRSSRKAHDSDLISWEHSHYRIIGECRGDRGEQIKLEVVSQVEPRKQRASFINDVRTPTKRYIGTLPLVTFSPDDLTLFTGSPTSRRRLIDSLLSQVSPAYLQALSEYDKAVKQRNTLLKQIREGLQKPESLKIWDEKIAMLGAMITIDRLQLFETMQVTILRELRSLGENAKSAEFNYLRKGTGNDEQSIQKEIFEHLEHSRERDIQILATTVGPHRDDWTLTMDGHSIASFASRGQQRAAILALLLLQASFLELRKGEKPVLLLDDVFSEFDEKHRAAVLHTLSENQVIITAVELDEALKNEAQIVSCPLS
jgi:DNA replication and repair protein RecF